MKSPHLYNIRIINTTINYIKNHYPDVDINSILEYAEIPLYELEDMGYWYTQRQADLFNEIIVKKTGNVNIPQEAGRFASKSGSYNTIRQYILGFITVEAAYSSIEHIASKLTRVGTFKTRKLGHNKVEITWRLPKMSWKSHFNARTGSVCSRQYQWSFLINLPMLNIPYAYTKAMSIANI